MEQIDLVIIGGGAGSFAAATRASELGAKVLIINSGLPIGGTCVNVGCVPSKLLLEIGSEYYHSRGSRFQAIHNNCPASFDFGAAIREKDEIVSVLRESNYIRRALAKCKKASPPYLKDGHRWKWESLDAHQMPVPHSAFLRHFASLAVVLFGFFIFIGIFGFGCQSVPATTVVRHTQLPLVIWLEASSKAKVGEPLLFKLKIQNRSSEALTFYGPADQYDVEQYDFIITQSGGKEVWRWSFGQAAPLVLHRVTLQPGETREFQAGWKQQDYKGDVVVPGSYFAKGLIKISLSDQPEWETMETKPWRLVIQR